MNKFIQKLNLLVEDFDNFSDETFKKSVLGKCLSVLSFSISKYFKSNDLLFKLLIFSIYILLGSLSLPHFATDRFGIGLIIIFCFFIFLLNVFSRNISSIKFNSIDFMILIFLLIASIPWLIPEKIGNHESEK